MYILAGAAVGLMVGVTGVGGGSLMTPLLLAFGFPLHVAVGTDLWFATLTKAGGVVQHSRMGNVRWDLVGRMAAGSLPAAGATILLLHFVFGSPENYAGLLTTALGITLIMTSVAIAFRKQIQTWVMGHFETNDAAMNRLLPFLGALLGVLVTLSSVGAGAIATAMLMIAYPALKSLKVVGTDIAHAVPLTAAAGIGHYFLGNVDFMLLGALLLGSIPAVSLGAKLGRHIPENIMRPLLASALCGIGVKFAFF